MSCVIIIPVYNSFEISARCVERVCAHSPQASAIIVVDDGSSEGEFSEFVRGRNISDSRLKIYRNQQNLGFVRACNFAFKLIGESDVVLLNSDVEVTKNWLKKLNQAAHSNPKVGTVTPLTNNGTICSFPTFGGENKVPNGFDLDTFAALVEAASAREYPILPTAVGFCMFIKGEVLKGIGGFDECFSPGYGEENDFCWKARNLGYINILDDATYVFHHGSVSFSEKREQLQKRNSKILDERYPSYTPEVSAFYRDFPLKHVHARILDEMVLRWNKTRKCRVLHVLHNGPYEGRYNSIGGVEIVVQGIIDSTDKVAHWSLVPGEKCYYLTAHLNGIHRQYVLASDLDGLKNIINQKHFDLIHLHHAGGYDYSMLVQVLKNHSNYICSLHDFFLVCPKIYLMTKSGKVCNGHECVAQCDFTSDFISRYRELALWLLEGARKVIYHSNVTKEYFQKILNRELKWCEMHHGIENVGFSNGRTLRVEKPSVNHPLRVAFIGYLTKHKGIEIISEVVKTARLEGGVPVEWHTVGHVYSEMPLGVVQYGTYDKKDIAEILAKINPHIVCILSACVETYSMTLSEAWNVGIPVVVTPYGAPAERVRAQGGGWVLSELSAEKVVATLSQVVHNWSEYESVRTVAGRISIQSTAAAALKYGDLYQEAVNSGRGDKGIYSLLSNLVGHVHQPYTLESLIYRVKERFNRQIKPMMVKFVPPRLKQQLKRMLSWST